MLHKLLKWKTGRSPIWLAGLLGFVLGTSADACIVFTLDSTQSMLTISGTWGGDLIIPQMVPDALSTPLSGNVDCEVDISRNTLRIMGGIVAADNNGSYNPPRPPFVELTSSSTVAPANFGISSDNIGLMGAVRNFTFGLSSSVVSSPGSFDASQVDAIINSGEVDYLSNDVAQIPGGAQEGGSTFVPADLAIDLTGDLLLASGRASLSEEGNLETLVIPMNTSITVDTDYLLPGQTELPLVINLSGQIVATGVVPEPASIWIAVFSLTFLGGRHRSKRLRRGREETKFPYSRNTTNEDTYTSISTKQFPPFAPKSGCCH